MEHSYLDLNAARDSEFGQKSPVAVPDAKTRSYQASVTEVVFEDQSVWTANEGTWESLAKPVALSISDPELLKQYQMHYGSGAKYEAKEEKDLWHCTCGALNHEGENCHVCGHSLFELQTVDVEKLTAEKDARLAEAARKAAEEQAAADVQKKKATKILAIVIPAVCAVVAIILLATKVIIPNGKYNDAVALMDAGSYEEVIAAFEAMDGYKDSVQKIADCELAILEARYNNAVALMETDVVQAYDRLMALNGYGNSTELAHSIYVEYELELIKNAAVGDVVYFGTYEQDNDTSNGQERIQWLVLDKKDDSVFLISAMGLDCLVYEDSATNTSWAACYARKWLNSSFLNNAFAPEEQTYLNNNSSRRQSPCLYRSRYTGSNLLA